jgi:hypothetical protein
MLVIFREYISLVDMLWEFQAEIPDTEAVYQEATFYCASTGPADSCPKAEP